MRYLNLLLIIFLSISWVRNIDPEKYTNNEIINLDVDKLISYENKPVLFSNLFSNFHIIPLETRKECVFSQISNIKLINDTIFILDRMSTKGIYFFTKQGKFINKIQKIGRGPGEYINVCDFDVEINDNSILIFVLTWNRRINIYNTNGSFIKDLKLEDYFSSLSVTSDGIFLFRSFPSQDSKDDYLIYLIDIKGKIIKKYLKYSEILQGPMVTAFSPGGNFFESESDVKFQKNYCNSIYSINKKALQPFITLNSNRYIISEKDIELYNKLNSPDNKKDISKSPLNIEKLSRISGYSENKEVGFFKFLIGFKEYQTFYFFKTKETICRSKFEDDLSFINPNLFRINNNQLIAYRVPVHIDKFIENVKAGKLKINEAEKNKLLKINAYDNPIIILYDLKRN